MVKYIVRLDDACPQMNYKKWRKVEKILDKYEIKPIVAVIPNNKDYSFKWKELNDTNFWDIVKKWQKKEWVIAMHGYDHVYKTRNPGIVPLNFKSEFAGLSYDEQKEKIINGYGIFAKKNILPKVWIAPGHSFDKVTLELLHKYTNIEIINDGFFKYPCKKYNFKWLPQQLWHFKQKKAGVFTICLHPNEMKDKDFYEMEMFLKDNKDLFVKNIFLLDYNRKCLKDLFFYKSFIIFYIKKALILLRRKFVKELG